MGHFSNAFDIDDGHNLTVAHPGTSFVGAVGVDWLAEKFYRITAPVISAEKQKSLIAKLCGDVNAPVRDIVDLINE